jgi:hypothetical protein
MVGYDRLASLLAGGSMLFALGSVPLGSGPSLWFPTIPPTPPLPPSISDVITFLGSGVFPGGSPATFRFAASCPLWISDPDSSSPLATLGSEVFTSPPLVGTGSPGCTTFASSGTVNWYQTCVVGSLHSAAPATSIAGPDGSLSGITYNLDLVAGIGLLSGQATENDAGGGSASVNLYGVALVESIDCDTITGRASYTIAGAVAVVENALSSS